MVRACIIIHLCCGSFAMFVCYCYGGQTLLGSIRTWQSAKSDICIDMLQVAFIHSNEGYRSYRSSAAGRLRHR